ncbi:hypothetical protein ACLOJK_019900 [Asimina triloba]
MEHQTHSRAHSCEEAQLDGALISLDEVPCRFKRDVAIEAIDDVERDIVPEGDSSGSGTPTYIHQDFPSIVRILLWMNDLEKNFYRVVSSAGVSYVKCSSANLTNDEKDFDLSLQSCLLPLRDGGIFHVEPYFSHRFAHQFGYDQGVLEHLPWDLSLSFNYRSDYGRKVMLLAKSGIERTSPGRILSIDLSSTLEASIIYTHYNIGWLGVSDNVFLFYDSLVEQIKFGMRWLGPWSRALLAQPEDRGFLRPPIALSDSFEDTHLFGNAGAVSHKSPRLDLVETSQEATPNPAADEEIIVDHTSPVRSMVDAGSVGSIGQTIGAIEGAALSTTLVSDSTTVVAATQSQENFVFADISIPSLSDLLGSGVGVVLTSMPEDEGFACRGVALVSDMATPKDADVALRNIASLSDEVKPPRPEGGGVAMVVDLDARGFGGDSSMGQHILAVVISV